MSGRDEKPVIKLNCPFCKYDTSFWILTDTNLDSFNNWGWLGMDDTFSSWGGKTYCIKPIVVPHFLQNLDNITHIRCRNVYMNDEEPFKEKSKQHTFIKGDKMYDVVLEEAKRLVREGRTISRRNKTY